MYELNEATKRNIENRTGIPVKELINMDWDEIDKSIENKIGKNLTFDSKKDSRLPMSTNVYISLNRLMSVKEADEKLSRI